MEAAGLFAAYFSILFGLILGIAQLDLLVDANELAIFYHFVPSFVWTDVFQMTPTASNILERSMILGTIQVVLGLLIILPSIFQVKNYLVRSFGWILLVGWYSIMTFGHITFLLGNTNPIEDNDLLYLMLFPFGLLLLLCALLGMSSDVGLGPMATSIFGQLCTSLTGWLSIGYAAAFLLWQEPELSSKLPSWAATLLQQVADQLSNPMVQWMFQTDGMTEFGSTLSKLSWSFAYDEFHSYFQTHIFLPTTMLERMECLVCVEALIAAALIVAPSILNIFLSPLLGGLSQWLTSSIRLIGLSAVAWLWLLQWIGTLVTIITSKSSEVLNIVTSPPMLWIGGRVIVAMIGVLTELLDDFGTEVVTTPPPVAASGEPRIAKVKKL